jgi:MFS family permease
VAGAKRTQISESLTAVRSVFANSDLRRVQLAFAGSIVGSYAYVIAINVFAFHHGGATAVGVFNFARLGVAALVAPLAASITDRYPRERVMFASDLIRVAIIGGAAAAVFAGAPSLVVYVLGTFNAVFGVVFRPAASALLPTLVRSPEQLIAANLSMSTFDSLGAFAGPALGAGLLVVGGTGSVFCVTAATFAWSAALISRVRAGVPTPFRDAEEGEHHGIWAGLRTIRTEPRLRLLIGLYGAQAVAVGALSVLVVATALDLLSLGNAGVGLLEAMSGLGSLVGAAVVLSLVGRKRLASDFGLGLVAWGVPLAILGLVPNVAVALVALAVLGAGNTAVDVSAMTLLQRAAPGEVAGRVFGVLESVFVGALGAGSLLAPALIAAIGLRGALVAIGVTLPLLVALRWRKLAAMDTSDTVSESRLAAIQQVPFLASLPLATGEGLARRLERVDLAQGEVLFELGDVGDRFYIVTEGAVEIDLPEGVKVEEAPCYVGEIALLHDIPRTATVRAARASVLWALARDDFLAAVTGHAASRSAAGEIAGARLSAS